MLKLIDFKLYPLDIYLHIGKDIDETLNQFTSDITKLQYKYNWDTCEAAVHYDIFHTESNRHAIVIAFEDIPTTNLIVHEIVHATYRIYNHIGQKNYGDESHAYLSEFIATEIETFINEYKLVQDDNI